jgi:hypothetical protein
MEISTAIREGHSATSLGLCFGVRQHTVCKWIARGFFGKVQTRTGEAWTPGSGATCHITDAQVLAFVRDHPLEFQLSRVNQTWFLDLVFNAYANPKQARAVAHP